MAISRIRVAAWSAIVLLTSTAAVRAQDGDPLDALKKRVDSLTGMVGDLTTNVESVTDTVKSNTGWIRELNYRVTELEDEVRKKDQELREVLEAISKKDSQGNHIVALNRIMEESSEFRSELHSAVNNSIDTVGQLVVHNQTASDYSLLVNRRQWLVIPAGQSRTMDVPVGTLTTELVGQEAAKNWSVGAPNYTQEINIEPLSQVVANRPVIANSPVVANSPVIVNSPVIAETPTYFSPPVYYEPPVIVESPIYYFP